MSSFKILSANCRGLQDYKKRKDVFGFLRDKKASIVCPRILTTVVTQVFFSHFSYTSTPMIHRNSAFEVFVR